MRGTHWKLSVGAVLLSLSALAAVGQAPDGPPGPPPDQQGPHAPGERGPEREFRMLTRLLSLTADQQTGVRSLLEQQASQMKALRNKSEAAAGSDTREAMQARMTQVEAIHNETNTKIAALLDETQKKTFADWTARRQAAMARRQAHDAGGPDQAPPPPPNE